MLMFLRCQTQWRTGPSGVIGFDYSVVFSLFDLYAVEDRVQVFDDLQVMESRALELIHEAAEQQAKRAKRNRQR